MPGQVLPYYLHGNDSGWDNSTMFDAGAPLIAPDLAAFLAIQCEVLGEIAGKAHEARHWREQSRQLIAALLAELWKGDHFVARRASDAFEVKCDSLVPLMPVLLGKRLPKPVARKLVAGIRPHLTEWGLATELTGSPHYTSDGYWRGPIWGPCTMIAVDGLMQLGEKKLAREIAGRFCRLCAKSGFAENFDALTGTPLRDTAYTWTSSVFLILAHEYRR
jgi:glycogen debranching enzyme